MSEEEIITLRKQKLERLRSSGVDPYPARVQRSHTAQEAVDILGDAANTTVIVTVTGRLRNERERNQTQIAFGHTL